MNPAEQALVQVLLAVLEGLGVELVKRHVDEWEAARAASDAAFRAKYGEDP